MATLAPVDEATEPFLSGRFAPVHDEISVDDLVVDGTLPTDLTGAYLRNGPNPKFPPLGSYTYPLEGDGMIHGVWFEGGRARYANRFVRTNSLKAEEAAGKAIFGGLMTPAFVDQSLLGPDPDPTWPFKLDADINIVGHAGRLLALGEGVPPYEVTPTLDTVGRYDFAGGLPAGITAHPKIDPVTGEMIVFRYDVAAPFLTWAVIGPDGAVTRPPTAVDGVDESLHDPRLRDHRPLPRHRARPLMLDVNAMLSGGNHSSGSPSSAPASRSSPATAHRCAGSTATRSGRGTTPTPSTTATTSSSTSPGPPGPGSGSPAPTPHPITGAFARATLDPTAGTIESTTSTTTRSSSPASTIASSATATATSPSPAAPTTPGQDGRARPDAPLRHRRRHQRPLRRPRRARRTDLRAPRRRHRRARRLLPRLRQRPRRRPHLTARVRRRPLPRPARRHHPHPRNASPTASTATGSLRPERRPDPDPNPSLTKRVLPSELVAVLAVAMSTTPPTPSRRRWRVTSIDDSTRTHRVARRGCGRPPTCSVRDSDRAS